MCTCACVCVCLYVCALMHVCAHACLHVCTHVCVCVHMRMYVSRTHTQMRTPAPCTCVCFTCGCTHARDWTLFATRQRHQTCFYYHQSACTNQILCNQLQSAGSMLARVGSSSDRVVSFLTFINFS